jgi:NodT family efflux transporter outer membrane factor (OMF) lipoprotein
MEADVASMYVNIRTLEERIRVAQRNADVQRESLRVAAVQFAEGETDELDVQQASTQLGETESQVPTLRAALQQDKDALAVLLGDTPEHIDGALLEGHAAEPGIPTTPASIVLGIPHDLLRRRPDVRSAEFAAAAQSAQIGVAKAALYPSLSLIGDFGFTATNVAPFSPTDLFRWNSRTFTAGPSFTFPFLDYGRNENLVRVQDSLFRQAVLNYQNAVLTAQQEVEDGLSAFSNAQLSRDRLADAVTAAKRSTELAVFRYKEGATDYTTVLTAEQAELRVEDEYASALGAVPLGLIATYRALGGGWQTPGTAQ